MLGTLAVLAIGCTSRAQSRTGARADLYDCEGCTEAIARQPAELSWSKTLTGEDEPGEALIVKGTVYMPDGITPAPGVVIYAHQTDDQGLYTGGPNDLRGRGNGLRLEGWVKTDSKGRYHFDTIKPAPYPSMTMPAHIHLYIGEPGQRAYYVDDLVFAGEFKVDQAYISAQELRGGSGIVQLQPGPGGVLLAQRDIVLERHPGS